jgi:hypothetical protein
VAERPDLAFDRENLRSLCTTCHAKREAEERGARLSGNRRA